MNKNYGFITTSKYVLLFNTGNRYTKVNNYNQEETESAKYIPFVGHIHFKKSNIYIVGTRSLSRPVVFAVHREV